MNVVDPNEILLTGENSYLKLGYKQGGPITTNASHWRVLMSPAGPGHVLFVDGELTDNQVKIYSDNVEMARWFQREIQGALHETFGDTNLSVAAATFSRHGDHRSYCSERVNTPDEDISLTWYDLGEPFLIHIAPGSVPRWAPYDSQGRLQGLYSVLIPAKGAEVVINGRTASGRAFPRETFGHLDSTCGLAWGETWVRAR